MIILLVEDDPDWVALFENVLEDIPHRRLLVAEDAREAINCLYLRGKYKGEGLPDIIWTDHHMAHGSGLTVIEEARKIEEMKHSPIILVTGIDLRGTGEAVARQAIELGCTSFVQKTNLEDLETMLRYWLTIAKW